MDLVGGRNTVCGRSPRKSVDRAAVAPCLRAGKNELLVRAYHRGEDFAVSRTVPATVAAGGIFSYRGGFWRGGEPASRPIGVGVLCIRPLSRQKGEKLK
ncbi:MAG: hypothetical protein ACLR3U_05210 [Christensenellaceae bacterium]